MIYRIQPLTNFAILIYFFSSFAYAQSLFNFNNNSTNATQHNPPVTQKQLSPEEFKNAVNQMGRQTQNQINQQVKSQYGRPTAQPAPPPPAAINPLASPIAPLPPNTAPSVYATPSTSPPPPTSRYGTQPAPTQSQVYTGFGTNNASSPNQGTTHQPSNNNKGWNIQY